MTSRQPVNTEPPDETLISQLTIQPDGRVYVFGASQQLLEVLEAINPADRRIRSLLRRVRNTRETG